MKYDYHVIIIGGGSAGLIVASGCATFGAKVALIEKDKMGGDCLNAGCVPSKAFLKSAHVADEIRNSKKFGIITDEPKVDLKSVKNRVKSVIAAIAPHDSKERFTSMGVDVISGAASFVDAHSVKTGDKILTGKFIVIATGSQPLVPLIPGLNEVPYLTNKNIFDLETLPKHLIILGGGPIGIEISQGFRYFGSEVTVIDMLPHLFPKDDPEVSPFMEKKLAEEGIKLKLSSKIIEVKGKANDITAVIQREGIKQEITGDVLLVALGRVPDNSGLNLKNAGILTDTRGYIIADKKLKTNVKNIFACGDITGPFQFTHMAGYQAGIVVRNIIFPFSSKADYSLVPWTTYTKPEVAHIGYTEPWAKSEGIYGNSILLELKGNDRAVTESENNGFIKLVTGKSGKLIGATIVAHKGSEMISLATLAIKKQLKPTTFAGMIFAYPSQSEIYKTASYKILKNTLKPWMKNIISNLFLR